jgi:hypothetical protein
VLIYETSRALTAVQLLAGPNVGMFRLRPTPTGRMRCFCVFTPRASALTKLAVTLPARFAGSDGLPVLVVYERCVPLPAERATAGI